jgi:hypothetical protein
MKSIIIVHFLNIWGRCKDIATDFQELTDLWEVSLHSSTEGYIPLIYPMGRGHLSLHCQGGKVHRQRKVQVKILKDDYGLTAS